MRFTERIRGMNASLEFSIDMQALIDKGLNMDNSIAE